MCVCVCGGGGGGGRGEQTVSLGMPELEYTSLS